MNIFIGNLNWKVEDEELRKAFEEYGDVESARVIKDRMTGRSRGFGFVEMPSDDDARSAIEALNGTELQGRPLNVSEARPRRQEA